MEIEYMSIADHRPTPCRDRLLRIAMSVFFVLLLLPVVLAAENLEHPIVFCQLSTEQVPNAPLAGGMLPAAYGAGARLVLLEPEGKTTDLAPDFASACDPDVSFDGKRILFAGQKEVGDPWNIWELEVGGSALRQITRETLDARSPRYLSTFYTITSSEPWYTILFVRDDGVMNEASSAPATSLYTVRLDGSELRRITFHPGNDRTPFLMQDGLVLFAGARSGPELTDDGMRIFGVQTDGIDYALYGATQGRRLQHMPTRTSDDLVVFVEGDSLPWDGGGTLGSVEARRPFHSYRPLTGGDDGLFHSPSPLADGTLLVSRRQEGGTYEIVHFSPADGVVEAVHDDPGHHAIHAQVVTHRPEPDGRSSTVRAESPTGKLFSLDVYESDPAFSGLERGLAKRVRVIEGMPQPGAPSAASRAITDDSTSWMPRRILGEASVEEDGSFHIDIPADLPVRLQLLDDNGLALATCDWIWVRQREFRGCIGCHEDPELTPPNRFVDAAARPANELTAPAENRRDVTFAGDVVPHLAASCTSCHRSGGAADGSGFTLDDTATPDGMRAAYASLRAYVDAGSARTSPAIWRLFGRNTSRSWDETAAVTPTFTTNHTGILAAEERTVLVEWIDLGARWSNASFEESKP
jgi:hypothetical protein